MWITARKGAPHPAPAGMSSSGLTLCVGHGPGGTLVGEMRRPGVVQEEVNYNCEMNP